MAIREIRWQNFRAFQDTGWLEIRPITILIGSNNSGKSSVLSPLLLLKQTLESKRAQSALVLRGDLINAGSYPDIVYGHDPKVNCTFALRFHSRPRPESDVPELGRAAPSICELTFKAEKAPGVVTLYRYAVRDSFDRPMMTRTKTASRKYTLTEIQDWTEATNSTKSGAPSDIAARKAVRNAVPYHFLFDSEPIFNEAIEAARRPDDQSSDGPTDDSGSFRDVSSVELSRFVALYSQVVSFVEEHVTDDLDNVIYLGPLRESPKRLYEISGDAPSNVGVHGQFSPEILLRGRRKQLFRQVNTWMRRFDLPGSLSFHQMTDTAFELNLISNEDVSTNFADIGFGFSQLLPLLVQGLSAEKGSLLITEQPEIHLNPRLQGRLGDFFVEVSKRGASILAETHSEHLILGLRRLVAEEKVAASDVAIYFTEAADGGSTIRRVPVQENGHVEAAQWPAGFFEDSLRESFALASAQARRRRSAD